MFIHYRHVEFKLLMTCAAIEIYIQLQVYKKFVGLQNRLCAMLLFSIVFVMKVLKMYTVILFYLNKNHKAVRKRKNIVFYESYVKTYLTKNEGRVNIIAF